jgi:V8-like Glu-specific endopeptidase
VLPAVAGAVLAGVVAAAGAGGPTPAAAAAGGTGNGGPAGHPAAMTAAEQRAVIRYWTPARMRAAAPGGVALSAAVHSARSREAWLTGNTAGAGLRWGHGGAVARSTGRVFFTLDDIGYSCSGSAVDAAAGDVVVTAAHCVSNTAGRWAANWIFVPGYRDGTEPYGAFTARRFFVSPLWAGPGGKAGGADERYDVAFVTVNSPPQGPGRNAQAAEVVPLPASQPVSFGERFAAGATYVFGYPAEPPYTGLYPNYCAGPARAGGLGGAWTRCAMTAGDSGGPWLARFSPRAGVGTIVAITTFKLSGDTRVLYATVLGPAARKLYQEAERSAITTAWIGVSPHLSQPTLTQTPIAVPP